MRVPVAALLLASCGRIGFEARPSDATITLDGDALPVAPACGTNVLLQDELDDTNALPLFAANTDPGVGLTEANGHLDVNFIAGGAAASTSAYYTSVSSYPIEGLCAEIQFSVIPTNGGELFFQIFTGTPQHVAAFDALPTTLFLVTAIMQVRDLSMTLAHDPSKQFWRLRTQNGTTFWDVSADGVTFYELWSRANFFGPTDTVLILFGAGTGENPTTAVDIARFERVRATGP